jgi:hypothetical protein
MISKLSSTKGSLSLLYKLQIYNLLPRVDSMGREGISFEHSSCLIYIVLFINSSHGHTKDFLLLELFINDPTNMLYKGFSTTIEHYTFREVYIAMS